MVLSLLAGPLCVPILRAHLDGPLRMPDLRERIDGSVQTTLRGQVGNLRAIGALDRQVRTGMPYTVENELTEAGRGILAVAEAVEAWLACAPQGPIALGSEPAKEAIKAIVGGWNSAILGALAVRPLSLTELDGVARDINYPSLVRRLSAMRAACQVESLPGQEREKAYAVTDWARRSVGPIAEASRCECAHWTETTERLTTVDLEAALLLAAPLAALPADQTGSCMLGIDTGASGNAGNARHHAGVHVEIERGEVVSCARLACDPGTWALGTPASWLDAVGGRPIEPLRLGGTDPDLARALVGGLQEALMACGVASGPSPEADY